MSRNGITIMWETEEYAIVRLMSSCKQQAIVLIIRPHTSSIIKLELIGILSRIRPYPPNFSKIPAKTMLPLVGASTCARGNQ